MSNQLTVSEIAKMIDHSLLRPEMTIDEIRDGCRVAVQYQVASVCVKPSELDLCRIELENTNIHLSTVIGFPHGGSTTASKLYEVQDAIARGCCELDVVLNIGRMISGDTAYVEDELKAIVQTAHERKAIVKVILENALLTDVQKVKACEICARVCADYVKTSTGYAVSGATIDDLKLMRKNTPPQVKVKAAGGIRTLDQLLAARAAGATRVGATATIAILEEAKKRFLADSLIELEH